MTVETAIIPFAACAVPAPGSALVLAPHPDDEVFGCAGAICAHLARGDRVAVLVITDGTAQGQDAAARRRESQAAAEVLGYGEPRFIGMPDRAVRYGEALVEAIVGWVKEQDAAVLYAPSPWELHPDHLAISMAASEAMRRVGGDRQLALYEVSAPMQPNRLLDITPYQGAKARAIDCFGSQLAVQRYDVQIAGLNRFRSYTLGAGVDSAEAFIVVSAQALKHGRVMALYASAYEQRQAQGISVDTPTLPLVSIICRTMGRAELRDALRSIALQTYPRIEVLVVDAAGSGLSLPDWQGRFPQRVIARDHPLPRSAAANAGLDAARGDYCLLLDEDDWIEPDHIHSLVGALMGSTRHPVAYAGTAIVDPQGQPTGEVLNRPFELLRLYGENFIPIHAALFTRSCILAGARFDESLDAYEDWDLWLQLAQHGPFLHVDRISAYYRQGGQSGLGAADVRDDDAAHERTRVATNAVAERIRRRIDGTRLHRLLRDAQISIDAERRAAVALSHQLAEVSQALAEVNRQLAEAKRELVRTQEGLADAQQQHDRILRSTPWRLTAPYRWLVRQLNRLGFR
jgi:LmbE family N-acetylglucosaminyl deacetylase